MPLARVGYLIIGKPESCRQLPRAYGIHVTLVGVGTAQVTKTVPGYRILQNTV